MGKTCLLTLIRSPAEEFNAVEDGVLEKISKMSPQQATNLLPQRRGPAASRSRGAIRQGADLNSFNFQRGALIAGGAPFAIIASARRPPACCNDARRDRRCSIPTRSTRWAGRRCTSSLWPPRQR